MTAGSSATFSSRCYRLLCKVPKGRVTTYGDIAVALGCKAYRAVGNAMNRNPNAPVVPCHRVVASDGSLNGYAGGLALKKKLLEQEGLEIRGGKVVDFETKRFRFVRQR